MTADDEIGLGRAQPRFRTVTMSSGLMRRVRAALPVLILAVASCSGEQATSTRDIADLAAAKRRWAQFAPAAYQITVTPSCFCPIEAVRPAIVTVRNGQVESRRYEDTGTDVPAAFATGYPTVDDLFDIITKAIGSGTVETVNVVYDATRGFPVSVLIDGSARIADDEMFYATRDFTVR